MFDRLADQFARLFLNVNETTLWTVLAFIILALYLLIRVVCENSTDGTTRPRGRRTSATRPGAHDT